ncbi:hypothetical protein ACFW9D_05880 [Streptomyces sp. NPDC059524]|uniref:hypothetical protein n=1 Tax=Streptomyces sp. NPDC059524 TaxID=3346856 RepID=UPI0036B93AF2
MTAHPYATDCEPQWGDIDPEPDDGDLPNDWRGQNIPAGAHITDIPLEGDYL